MGMSLIIFGGASQIILLQLFSGGASSLVIISSVGAVNSRHLLYGAVVSEHISDLKLVWKIIISYFLIDQAFAVSNIGAGSAVAVVIFIFLLFFSIFFFRYLNREEGL